MWEKILEWLKGKKNDLTQAEIDEFKKIVADTQNKSGDEIKKAIDEFMAKAGKTDPVPPNSQVITDPALKSQLDELKKTQDDLVKKLGEEATAREAGLKALQDKAKTEREAEIKKIIEDAINKDFKIPAKNEEQIKLYTDLLNLDFEKGKKVIESLPKLNGSNPKTDPPKSDNPNQPVDGQDRFRTLIDNAKADLKAQVATIKN